MPIISGKTGGSGGGTTWLAGAGAPAAGLGTTGDWYENQSNRDVYNKILGATVAGWVSNGTVLSDTNGTSHVVSMPSSVAAGDLLILNADSINITFGLPAPTFTTPTGWTRQVNRGLYGSSTAQASYTYSRVADGTEGASVTVTSDVSAFVSAVVSRVTGASATAPINAVASGSIAPGSTPATPAVTTLVPNCLVVSYVNVATTLGTAAVPSGMSKRFEFQDVSASWDNYMGWADLAQATPNTVTPNVWTFGSTDGITNWGTTLAIAPASGTAGWVRIGAFAA